MSRAHIFCISRIFYVLPLFLIMTFPDAKTTKNKLGYVDVNVLIQKMPNSAKYLDLSARVNKDLDKRVRKLQQLTQKAASGSAKDRTALIKAQQSYQRAQTNYRSRLKKAFAPLSGKLDTAMAKTAKANGYSVIMDQQVAARSKLVIYASPRVDLTKAVQKRLK